MAIDAEFVFDGKPWQEMIASVRKKWDDIEARKTFGAIVSSKVYADIMDHFAKEQGPGGKWQPWSAAYAEHLAKSGKGGNMILQDSGRLRQSFAPTSWVGNDDGILFFNNAKTKGGFPYAKAHNEGGPRLPQRQFMWLSERGLDGIIDVVEKWLNPLNEEGE